MTDEDKRVKAAMERHGFFGWTMSRLESGLFNDSYLLERGDGSRLEIAQDDRLILRIAPPDQRGALFYERNMMRQEPEVHRLVRENTIIPVPRIYYFDDSRDIMDRDYMLMEWMPGTPMSQASMSQTALARAFRHAGRYLSTLHHEVQRDRFGYLGAHRCMPPQSTWMSAFEVMWGKLCEDVHTCGVYAVHELKKALQAFENRREAFRIEGRAALLHMDIWAQNILVDHEGNITAILDWDRALWGDPGIEFAVLEYCGFDNAAFNDGYGQRWPRDDQSGIRAVFYHLYEVQKYLVIWRTRRAGRDGEIENYKKYCLDTIDKMLQMQ